MKFFRLNNVCICIHPPIFIAPAPNIRVRNVEGIICGADVVAISITRGINRVPKAFDLRVADCYRTLFYIIQSYSASIAIGTITLIIRNARVKNRGILYFQGSSGATARRIEVNSTGLRFNCTIINDYIRGGCCYRYSKRPVNITDFIGSNFHVFELYGPTKRIDSALFMGIASL